MPITGHKRILREIETPSEYDIEYLNWFKKYEHQLKTPKLLEASEKVGNMYDRISEDADELMKEMKDLISENQRDHVHDNMQWRDVANGCENPADVIENVYYEIDVGVINTAIENADIDPSLVDELVENLARDAPDLTDKEYETRIQEIIDA
ncbi:hypothetical protein EXVG_00170 [Emiliania huxleyi virus 202]|nr:hypothetical protein EXVG_00170 [Emiliania huxleyi virus 202]AHA54397.1 hypothetical protein EhV18_00351 [Emiliania huxleyi virus 18]AHA55437.1 hypothetical protein EhV156_00342 [Emiliania huxleyi virus 156]